MKKWFTYLLVVLSCSLTITPWFVRGAAPGSSNLASAQYTYCQDLDSRGVYALTSDNAIYVRDSASFGFNRVFKASGIDGNLIGIDFRPADNNNNFLYGVTDSGKIYRFDLQQPSNAPLLISSLGVRFSGGNQSLMDFNPVVNALRLMGSNDQNVAVVNSNGGNLNQAVAQTALSYVTGDPNSGVDPNITAGAYTNNFPGATQTTIYMLDYDRDTLVTIDPATPGGSSATGGGKLRTVGPIVDSAGNPILIAPTAGLDIYTGANGSSNGGSNVAVIVSGTNLYCIDLSTINTSLTAGTLQNVVASVVPVSIPQTNNPPPTGGFIDVAVTPFAAQAGAQADVMIQASAFPDPVGFTYQVTVTNNGPNTTAGGQVLGRFPISLSVVDPGTCTSDPNSGLVTCTVPSLPRGGTSRFAIRVFPQGNFFGSTQFSLNGFQNDPNSGNDTVYVKTPVR